MMIIMSVEASEEQLQAVLARVEANGFKAHVSRGEERTVIGVLGNNPIQIREQFIYLPGIDRIVPISRPYKIASRELVPHNTVFPLDGITIGGDEVIVMAGPCAVESRSQLLETAQAVKEAGAQVLRGGAYKPRTSPYAFQGLGEEGLEILAEARELTGLPVVTEVMAPEMVPLVARYADVLQIGARNMQNFALLHAAGESQRPVLLKRGIAATIDELLMAAEYILSHGNRARHPVRARHPHLRDLHPQYHRHQRHPGAQSPHPPAGGAGPQPQHGPLAVGHAHRPRGHRRRGRRADRRSPHPPRRRALRRRAVAQARALRPAGAPGARDRARRGAEVDMSDGEPGFLQGARVAILGLGLMGGSLALALRGRCAALLGVDADAQVVQMARQRRVVDLASTDAGGRLPQADLIVLAAPVNAILRLLEELPRLHPGPAIVIDLGSTKARVLEAMGRLPERFDPLGGHPMCGKEISGLANAEAGLFQGAAFAFTPLARTSSRARGLARELCAATGAHPVWLDAATHDRWVAATSHLPYLLANALAAGTPLEAAPLAGPGFRSSTRLAPTPPGVILDVLMTNRENVLASLRGLRARLEGMESLLAGEDFPALQELLAQGAQQYRQLLESSSQGNKS